MDWEPWVKMGVWALGLFGLCKVTSWRAAGGEFRERDFIGYALGWVGMNRQEFIRPVTRPPDWMEWGRPVSCLCLGIVLLAIAVNGADGRGHPEAVAWIAMVGILFFFHFGLFGILAQFWRWRGRDVRPIMNFPPASASLAEFWGKRWNRAFRDLSYLLIYQPLGRRFSVPYALFITFLISGVVHELVITVPVASGYGGPTLYFVIQSVGMVIERKIFRRKSPVFNRVWAWGLLLLPLPLCFPQAFRLELIYPMIVALRQGIVGA